MKKIILNLLFVTFVLLLSSCSNSEKLVITKSNTGVINSGSISNNKTISGSIVETKVKKKGCEVIYENVSKSTLKKRRFSFFIEGDCKDKIINGDSTQDGNLLETPNGIKFEIQDASGEYTAKSLMDYIKLTPFNIMNEDKNKMPILFVTDTIENKNNLQIQTGKVTIKKEHNDTYIDNIIMANFDTFLIKNYSESFQKNLNESNIDETYNELKTILSTVKELPSVDVNYDYETVDLSKIIVKGNTFILKDKNGFEKTIKVDQTRIYKDFTIEEFEDQCRKTCSFLSLKGNSIEWEIEVDGNYYSEFTDIITGNRISGGFESSGGFDNLD